jgi:Arc/MetJ-type ribon-helix-helix transcriptional regulator
MTYGNTMSTIKVAITIQDDLLRRVDSLVSKRVFPNRSKAIQDAVREKLERFDRGRLARESAKLDPEFEKAMADEGMSRELKEWPEY